MALFTYLQQTQRLIGDIQQRQIAPNDIIFYINTARRHVAELTQSIRVLTPISGSITSITTLTGGTNYTSPSVTVTPPDFPGGTATNPGGLQATAVAHLSGNSIASITMVINGSGYFQPQVTITDPTGTGATASAVVSPINTVNQNQEVYQFSNMPLGSAPGVASILAIKSVAIIFDNYRYPLPQYSFTIYQAYVRRYPFQYTYMPTVSCQYGQGINGSLYLYPLPNNTYQLECDCFALPIDLVDDTTFEALPLPWTDSVSYYAAYLAFLEKQDRNAAREMLDLFDKMLLRQSVSARPGRSSNPLGRW